MTCVRERYVVDATVYLSRILIIMCILIDRAYRFRCRLSTFGVMEPDWSGGQLAKSRCRLHMELPLTDTELKPSQKNGMF